MVVFSKRGVEDRKALRYVLLCGERATAGLYRPGDVTFWSLETDRDTETETDRERERVRARERD